MCKDFRRWVGLFIVLMSALSCLGLHEGQTPEAVLEELGPPNGKRQLAGGEIWVYSGDITLEFSDGQLVRAKGLSLTPRPVAEAVRAVADPAVASPLAPEEADPGPSEVEDPDFSPASGSLAVNDEELMRVAESISDPQLLLEEAGWDQPPPPPSMLALILSWTVPLFLQWVFLWVAFKWVGAEAMSLVLLGIAAADRLVTAGVRWIFLDWLGFPTTFHADAFAGFVVMLGMVTTLTHARQLPTAIKVVVASKVAALVAGYVFILFVLHNL